MNPGATSPFSPENNGTPSTLPATPSGAASSFGGSGATGIKSQSAPETYTIPGTYGHAPITLTAGEGRLARPLFRFNGTIGFGFDDNVFQAPTRGPSTPTRVVQEVVSPATPAQTQIVNVQQVDGTVVPEKVEIPASPATTVGVTIPGVPAAKRQASFITRSNLGADVQFASRATVFTLDLNGGVDYYWDRPGSKEDYNGSVALAFLHKLSPLAQITANINAAYLTQPNLSLVNTPTNNNVGPYLNLNARGDLSYRLMPRFSTVLSVSYGTTYYTASSQQANTFGETTFGTELRYLFSPLLTLVGELRYASIDYPSDPTRAGDSYYVLGGADLTLSRRFSATVRVGEDVRNFDEGDISRSSPYLELTGTYALSRATSVQLSAHYGLEEPPDANTTLTVLRTGLTLSEAFTPRVMGNLATSLVHELSTDDTSGAQLTENTVEVGLGLTYTLSRHWSFSLNYTYDVLFSAGNASDYYRNRIFLTGNYTF
jgi:opacity protein-like surface antigen